jgi:hypothetical protein
MPEESPRHVFTRTTPPRASLRTVALIAFLGVVAIASGCGEDEQAKSETVEPALCVSGRRYTSGDGPLAHPGADCIGCHTSSDEDPPRFTIAGTTYAAPRQADDCWGMSGPTVEVTDATGKIITLTTNEAGTFFSEEPIAPPIRARVITNGKVRAMKDPVPSGNCASCHTRDGVNGAPGRLLVP